jgi:hypothetical protein
MEECLEVLALPENTNFARSGCHLGRLGKDPELCGRTWRAGKQFVLHSPWKYLDDAIESTRNMESLWDETKVLLMLSIRCEAWGIFAIEMQIRGIPVIASDAGAIHESKTLTSHILCL